PRVLTIGKQGQLEMTPAAEVEKLRGPMQRASVSTGQPCTIKLDTLRREIHLASTFSTGKVSLRLTSGSRQLWDLTIDVAANTIRSGDVTFPLPGLPWPNPSLRLFVDGSVVECFIGGREALTSRVYGLKSGASELIITAEGSK